MKRLPTIDLIFELAARESIASEYEYIEPSHLLTAILEISQIDAGLVKGKLDDPYLSSLLLDELDEVGTILRRNGTDPAELVKQVRDSLGRGGSPFQGGTIHRSADSKEMFKRAASLAVEKGATFMNAAHLLQVILERKQRDGPPAPDAGRAEDSVADSIVLEPNSALEVEVVEEQPIGVDPDPVNLVETAQRLRKELQEIVFGQDQALITFLDSLSSSEILAGVESERNRPKAAFLFAGPSEVGKTHLAQCTARILNKPFKRIDMSSPEDPQAAGLLAGVHRNVDGCRPGIMTDFVARNPDCLIVVRRIENADPGVVRLLTQVLEEGVLEDQFTEQPVSFAKAVIVFTTQAGKALYENPGPSAAYSAEFDRHRTPVMDLLKAEQDPVTGRPVLPQTLFLRGFDVIPIVFTPLSVNALIDVAEAEMNRMGALLEKQYEKRIEHGPDVPPCLVLREGIHANAGTLRSEVEAFVKTEIFNFFKMCRSERLQKLMQSTQRILFKLDEETTCPHEVVSLLTPPVPGVLLVADPEIEALWIESITGVEWIVRRDGTDIDSLLQSREIDLVLIDLMVGATATDGSPETSGGLTMFQFDYVPWAASGVALGRQILSTVHQTGSDLPCFLISYTDADHVPGRPTVDYELLSACIQSGQVQGVVETGFVSGDLSTAEVERVKLERRIRELARGIHLERTMRHGDYRGKVLSFETAPSVSPREQTIRIRLRNLKLLSITPMLDPADHVRPREGQRLPISSDQEPAGTSAAFVRSPLSEPLPAEAQTERPIGETHLDEVRHESPEPEPMRHDLTLESPPYDHSEVERESAVIPETPRPGNEADSLEPGPIADDESDEHGESLASEPPEQGGETREPESVSDEDEFSWD